MDRAETIEAVTETLEGLRGDEDLSRGERAVIEEMLKTLDDPVDLELRADKIRDLIDSLDQDRSLPNHVRMQLWSVSAMLEML